MKTLKDFETLIMDYKDNYVTKALHLGKALSEAQDTFFNADGAGFRRWTTGLGVQLSQTYKYIGFYKRFGGIEEAYSFEIGILNELDAFSKEVDASLIVSNVKGMKLNDVQELKVLVNNGEVELTTPIQTETAKETIMRLAQTLTKEEMLALVSEAYPEYGYVYFVRSGAHVKIGQTKNLEQRFSSLRTGMAEFEVLFVLKTTAYKALEKELHKEYEECVVNREWFQLSPRDLRIIKEQHSDLLFEV